MSKHHSTVSRRDFMKGLGLAGAGLGAAAATAPVFHDLDEAMVSPTAAVPKRPWWVNERELYNPTVEIDWSKIERLDQRIMSAENYRSSNHPDAVYTRENVDAIKESYVKKRCPEWKGNTTRDYALSAGGGVLSFWDAYKYPVSRGHPGNTSPWLGIRKVKTAEETGMPKWQGTPEENLRLLRQAARLFGAEEIAVVPLDEKTHKLVKAYEGDGSTYTFEDVDQSYETDTKKVIPNKCKWVIVWTAVQPTELSFRPPAMVADSCNYLPYTNMVVTNCQIQEFLHALGYHGLSGYSGALAPSNPFGALSGIGEHTRMAFILISPEYGSMIRGMNRIVTDLPLAPTKPIDAGIARFCLTCKICAVDCPFGALELGDPSWEHTFYQPGGFKGWRMDVHKCPFCRACHAMCPFSSVGASLIHDVVRATVSTTSIFNSFFTNMDTAFGYGFKNPETWWDLDNEPVGGIAVEFRQH